jgi:hypothetical protein
MMSSASEPGSVNFFGIDIPTGVTRTERRTALKNRGPALQLITLPALSFDNLT